MVEAKFFKAPGTSKAGPYIEVTASDETQLCRIDTGADITTLQITMLKDFEHNWGSDVLVRGFDGKIARKKTRSGWLLVNDTHIYLAKVLAVVGEGHGIIGMDVIKHFALLIVGSTVILE
jgi:hypothetical protein